MLFFYNKKMLGETLLVTIKPTDETFYEFKKNITLIRDKENNLVGLNIFNVESFKLSGEGIIELLEEQKKSLLTRLEKVGITLDINGTNDDYFVVGEVLTKEKHKDADKLSVTTVNVGEETLQIVCGASNVEVGQKVVVATVGAMMPSGLLIKQSKLRGVESHGMLCSKRELGLPCDENTKGILVLDKNTEVGIKIKDINL